MLLGQYESQLDELDGRLQNADKEITTLHTSLTEKSDELNQLKAE